MQVVLFVGDDWAEDHHDVEVRDATGRRLGKAWLPEGMAGIARLHALIGEFTDPDDEAGAGQVLVGIETDRGPWVAALVAAGYRMCAVNPMQVARYRERHCPSGAKSDAADAHTLADMVRTDAHQLRPVAGDTALAEGITVVARAHQSMIWDRTRQVPRLRSRPREFFPAALEVFPDLAATDALELLAAAPDPTSAATLSRGRVAGALQRARRRDDARARRNYAGTSPITRTSGKKKIVLARYARNDRLADALDQQAFRALTASPGARAYYDTIRARGTGQHAALRQLGNRLLGILHGCLTTGTDYDETIAWAAHHTHQDQKAAA